MLSIHITGRRSTHILAHSLSENNTNARKTLTRGKTLTREKTRHERKLNKPVSLYQAVYEQRKQHPSYIRKEYRTSSVRAHITVETLDGLSSLSS